MFKFSPFVTFLLYFTFVAFLISYLMNTNLKLLSPEAQLFISVLFGAVTYILLHEDKDEKKSDKDKK